jgi:hypothetical protein
MAREWLSAMASSFAFHSADGILLAAPTWLPRRYTWGPNPWPLAWCDAVRRKTIDCGVFSAFAREILSRRGIECYAGQIVQSFTESSYKQWRRYWADKPGTFAWCDDEFIYHEVVIVASAKTGEIFDATKGRWISPAAVDGYGGVIAVRSECPRTLKWGPYDMHYDQWSSTK